jgi:polyisoprenoid-binding protein YceI
MKRSIIAVMFLPTVLFGQKLIDRSAYAHFYSSTPVEDIEAVNNQAMGVVDMASGQVAVSMNMVDFVFEKSLMQEHFNENYVESDKYPKATFTGTIDGFQAEEVKEAQDSVTYTVRGNMTIHGQTNEITAAVSFIGDKKKLTATTLLVIALEDYDIDIPKVVLLNIAEEVEVTARFSFDLSKEE